MTSARSSFCAALLVALLVAACDFAQRSAAPSDAAAPIPIAVGCANIEAAECQVLVGQITASLPAGRGRPFAIEIDLFPCENAEPCPRSLAFRGGMAIVDYVDGGEPIQLTLVGPPQNPGIAVAQNTAWSGPIQPASKHVGGAGPFPFELGHCGLFHMIDFDGSFWVPIGQLDGEASGFINGESGQMRLAGPNLAIYEGANGFTAQLARFPGPKRFWLCD